MNVTNDPSSFIWRLQTADYYAKLPVSYDGWVPGQPNNGHRGGFCLALAWTYNYLWLDIGGSNIVHSVCEIDIA